MARLAAAVAAGVVIGLVAGAVLTSYEFLNVEPEVDLVSLLSLGVNIALVAVVERILSSRDKQEQYVRTRLLTTADGLQQEARELHRILGKSRDDGLRLDACREWLRRATSLSRDIDHLLEETRKWDRHADAVDCCERASQAWRAFYKIATAESFPTDGFMVPQGTFQRADREFVTTRQRFDGYRRAIASK